MTTVRASVVQAASVAFDREKTLEKVGDLAAYAARDKAQLVLFPEAFISAYPRGLDFGAKVGSRSPEGREDYRRYFDSAVDVPGPTVDALAAVAGACDIYLVIGVIERDGGTLYCSVLFFGRVGGWRGDCRVRWLFRCFRSGPQSVSLGPVSRPPLIKPDVRISRIRLSDEIMPSRSERPRFAA